MPDEIQIVPPAGKPSSSIRERWHQFPPAGKAFTALLSGSVLLGLFTFCLGQFFQIRGVQHVPTSRIFLACAAVILALFVWGLTWAFCFSRRKQVTLAATIVISLIGYWIDRIYPPPIPKVMVRREVEKGVTPEKLKIDDDVAINIHRSDQHVKVPAPTRTGTQSPEKKVVPKQPEEGRKTVSLDLIYDAPAKALNFTNRGQDDIYLWGDKIDEGPKSLDVPRTITRLGGTYHIWADAVVAELVGKLGLNGELRIPFEVYVTTNDKQKHIVTYQLWARTKGGVLTIETQNLGTTDADF